jgi:hypothetical protein
MVASFPQKAEVSEITQIIFNTEEHSENTLIQKNTPVGMLFNVCHFFLYKSEICSELTITIYNYNGAGELSFS